MGSRDINAGVVVKDVFDMKVEVKFKLDFSKTKLTPKNLNEAKFIIEKECLWLGCCTALKLRRLKR